MFSDRAVSALGGSSINESELLLKLVNCPLSGREETQRRHGVEAPAGSENEGKGPDPPPVTGRPPAIGNNDDLSRAGALAGRKK